ncbi:MAG: response regulator [Rhodospirillaceae bacterium]|nr:response regulator [Rhodospirillaceae bacterium]
MARVFVIDDDPLFREGLELSLEVQGHTVRGADCVEDAIAMMSADQPDVVVSDILSPTEHGIAVLRDISQRWPDLPVIVMSGGGKVDNDLSAWARSLGAVMGFNKPFETKDLSKAIVEIASRSGGSSA